MPSVICNMVYKVWDIPAAREAMSTCQAVIYNMFYEVTNIIGALETKSKWASVICNIVHKVWDLTAAPKTVPPCPSVICSMVYKVFDITTVRETMSPCPSVICNMVYEVWDIAAAPQTMSPCPSVICNMVYEVKLITVAPETMTTLVVVTCNMVCKVWDITAAPKSMCTCPVVICNMVYEVWDITVAPETISPCSTLTCNMVYVVNDMTAAPVTMSTLAAVLCNIVYKVWHITTALESMSTCPAEKTRRRMVALRAVDYKRKKELKEKNRSLRMSQSRVSQVVDSREKWRAKALGRNMVAFSFKRQLLRTQNPSLFHGGRYKASVRYCAYCMMRDLTSANKVGQLIVHGVNAFGIHVSRVPCKRTFDRWRVEGGEWAKECAALGFTQAKKSSKNFAMCMGRDGTQKEGWHFQCNPSHAIDESAGGRWIHAISQCPLTHNKTATTQSELTHQGIDELHSLSRGIVALPPGVLPTCT